jgi:branched-chain amino acid transport system ATP-binding protein
MAEPFLLARDIVVQFGGLTAVDGASVEVDDGQIVGVIGPNGAGKTTLFQAILGTLRPAAGSVHLGGVDVSTWSSHRRARAGVGRTFQRAEIFGSMTVRENLELASEAHALGERPWRLLTRSRYANKDEVDQVLDLLGVAGAAEETAGDLPIGLLRLVELGRALCTRPRLLMLDEPSSGLDATETAALGRSITDAVRERGLGVLLIEHDMSLALGLSEHLYVLDFGRLLATGSPAEIVENADVQQAYLGASDVA